MLVPWTALRPSSRARRWRLAGVGIAIASAAPLDVAAVVAAPLSREQAALTILAAIAGVLVCVTCRRRPLLSLEIGVSTTGEVEVRDGKSSTHPAQPFQLAFAAPWLISLRRGTMFIPIWPDCLPQSVYRRLWVHLRWKKAARSDDDQRSTPAGHNRVEDR